MTNVEPAKIEQAASADKERILALLHDPSPQVISTLLANRNLTEEDVLVIVTRKNLPPEIFAAIARDKRWAESYPIRKALAANPKTPLSVSLSLARFLRLFDLAEMTRSPQIPLAIRHKIEAIIMERIPTMPLGLKKSLAKIAVGNILLKLLQDHDAGVIALCLSNPRLIEGHLYKIISRKDTISETIRMIAEHPNWSNRSLIRFALVRNDRTPLPIAERFLLSLKILELRELYQDPSLPVSIKPLVYRELLSRGQDPGKRVEETFYEVVENDDNTIDDFTDTNEPEDGIA